jgi:hypothetical protein
MNTGLVPYRSSGASRPPSPQGRNKYDVIDVPVEVLSGAAGAGGMRKAGDMFAGLGKFMPRGLGKASTIAKAGVLGSVLGGLSEFGDSQDSLGGNTSDALGATVGGLGGAALPLVFGASGPVGWAAAAALGLLGSNVGKGITRGVTDAVGLTTPLDPFERGLRQANRQAEAVRKIKVDDARAMLPVQEAQLAQARDDAILRARAELEARQQLAFQQTALSAASSPQLQAAQQIAPLLQGIVGSGLGIYGG